MIHLQGTLTLHCTISIISQGAHFIFARHPKLDGKQTYLKLKAGGILVRHFDKPRLNEYNRITIGSREQMAALVEAMRREVEAAE